jgi:hypothetical protein
MNLKPMLVRRQPVERRVWLPNGHEEVAINPPVLDLALRKVNSRRHRGA